MATMFLHLSPGRFCTRMENRTIGMNLKPFLPGASYHTDWPGSLCPEYYTIFKETGVHAANKELFRTDLRVVLPGTAATHEHSFTGYTKHHQRSWMYTASGFDSEKKKSLPFIKPDLIPYWIIK